MKVSSKIIAWPVAFAMLILRATCRMRLHNDPRPALRASSEPYVYAVLHAHQVATVIDGERGTGAMLSRSADGELLAVGVWLLGIRAFRGSSQSGAGEKGGRSALAELILHVLSGSPAYLSVDGPRGPRNRVHKGIAVLSRTTGAAVVNVVAIPSRRWIIGGAWDRLQIPKPFCRIDAYFAEPLRPRPDECVEDYRQRIEDSLNQLEQRWDPAEALDAEILTEFVSVEPNCVRNGRKKTSGD